MRDRWGQDTDRTGHGQDTGQDMDRTRDTGHGQDTGQNTGQNTGHGQIQVFCPNRDVNTGEAVTGVTSPGVLVGFSPASFKRSHGFLIFGTGPVLQ